MNNQSETEVMDELSILKQRATTLGVAYSPNIGLETLRQRVEDCLGATQQLPTRTLRDMLYEEHMRLVRVRITNLDPSKRNVPGEIIAVGNDYLGTIRKYIPYGEVTDDGYHIPMCIYNQLKERKFNNIRHIKDPTRPGETIIHQSWAQEFAIEVLPPLTSNELKELATVQSAAALI